MEKKPHFVVVTHGMTGGDNKLEYLVDVLQKSIGDHSIVYIPQNNLGSKVKFSEGIEEAGKVLHDELQTRIQEYEKAMNQTFTHISFVGYMVGGLVNRYCVGRGYNNLNKSIFGLTPHIFLTIGTPHLGLAGHFSSAIKGVFIKTLHSKTFDQLMLKDAVEVNGELAEIPVMLKIADNKILPFISALESFKFRIFYANTNFDVKVPWSSGIALPYKYHDTLALYPVQKDPRFVHVTRVLKEPIKCDVNYFWADCKNECIRNILERMYRNLNILRIYRVDVSISITKSSSAMISKKASDVVEHICNSIFQENRPRQDEVSN